MRIGKLSILLCFVAPAFGVTAARVLSPQEHDFYGVGPIAAGLAIFAVLTLAAAIAGALAWSRGSPAGRFAVVWSALSLLAIGLWAASFSLQL